MGERTPRLRASMYFAYGRDRRDGIASKTTFDAILAGERTSTTRFPAWPGHERWLGLRAGDVVRFHEDRAMRGRHVDVEIVAGPAPIDLAGCDAAAIEAWSLAEGWTVRAGRDFGRRYGTGVQLRYRLLGDGAASGATT